jgi:hypothetical protein
MPPRPLDTEVDRMNRSRIRSATIASGIACLLAVTLSASAHAATWSPFRWLPRPLKQSKQTKSRMALLGGSPLVRSQHSDSADQSSMLGKVGSGTRKALSTATGGLLFKKQPTTTTASGGMPAWSRSTKQEESSRSWLGSLFARDAEPQPPKTPGEFLSLKRPDMLSTTR